MARQVSRARSLLSTNLCHGHTSLLPRSLLGSEGQGTQPLLPADFKSRNETGLFCISSAPVKQAQEEKQLPAGVSPDKKACSLPQLKADTDSDLAADERALSQNRRQDSMSLLLFCFLWFCVFNCFLPTLHHSQQATPTKAAEKVSGLNKNTRGQMGQVGGHGAKDMKLLKVLNTSWEILPSFEYSVPGGK